MAITDIRLSFLRFNTQIGVANSLYYQHNALAAYNADKQLIVVNFKLIMHELYDKKSVTAEGKTFEQLVCYVLTHEEIHHWIETAEGSMPSIMFDNVAEKFMRGM